MDCTPNFEEVRGFSSTLSFAIRTSLRSAAICSRIGPIIRHGPHHGAQKSTTTEPLAIVFAKSASVIVTGFPPFETAGNGALHFPQTAAFPLASGGTRFD